MEKGRDGSVLREKEREKVETEDEVSMPRGGQRYKKEGNGKK